MEPLQGDGVLGTKLTYVYKLLWCDVVFYMLYI